jgi:hypothetical protein
MDNGETPPKKVPDDDPHVGSDKPKEKVPSDQLGHIAHEAQDILYEAVTVFPFRLNTDTITIDREKVTVASRPFFGAVQVVSMQIKDLVSVIASTAPLFGTVTLAARIPIQDCPMEIHYLRREDTLNIKALLQGYIIAMEKGVDCDAMPLPQLKEYLYKIGRSETPSQP